MSFEIDKKTYKITMNEGDFGIILNFIFSNIEENSNYRFIVYDILKEDKKTTDIDLLKKTILNNELIDNKLPLELTEEESKLIPEGEHYWRLVQYIDNELKNTLFRDKKIKVEKGG